MGAEKNDDAGGNALEHDSERFRRINAERLGGKDKGLVIFGFLEELIAKLMSTFRGGGEGLSHRVVGGFGGGTATREGVQNSVLRKKLGVVVKERLDCGSSCFICADMQYYFHVLSVEEWGKSEKSFFEILAVAPQRCRRGVGSFLKKGGGCSVSA